MIAWSAQHNCHQSVISLRFWKLGSFWTHTQSTCSLLECSSSVSLAQLTNIWPFFHQNHSVTSAPPPPTKPVSYTQLCPPLWLPDSRRCCSFVFAALQTLCLHWWRKWNHSCLEQCQTLEPFIPPTNEHTGRLSGHAYRPVGVRSSLYLGIYFLPVSSDLFGQL